MSHPAATLTVMSEPQPVRHAPVIVSLPIADRRVSHDFYRAALGLAAVGEVAEDGLPEPLQFEVNEGLRLMLA